MQSQGLIDPEQITFISVYCADIAQTCDCLAKSARSEGARRDHQ